MAEGSFAILKSKLEGRMERLKPQFEKGNHLLRSLDAKVTDDVKVGGNTIEREEFEAVANNLATSLRISERASDQQTIRDKLDEMKFIVHGATEMMHVDLNFKEAGGTHLMTKVELMSHKDAQGKVNMEYCKFGERVHMNHGKTLPREFQRSAPMLMDYLTYNACSKMRNNSSTKVKDSRQNCPHCNRDLTWEEGVYKDGLVTRCCYPDCGRTSILIDCYFCSRSIAWKSAKRDKLAIIRCPYDGCHKRFQAWNCQHCKDIIYNDKCNIEPGGRRKCPYAHCSKEYQL